MSSVRKPVIVRLWTRQWFAGYLGADPESETGHLEMLDDTGKLLRLPWESVKWVCYVRDLVTGEGTGANAGNPERLVRKRFSSRPRAAGVWMQLTLTDGEELEGLAANDRSLVAGVGLMLTPPDTRSNAQRLYVPMASIRELTVLAVIGPGQAGRNTGRPAGAAPGAPVMSNVASIASSGFFTGNGNRSRDFQGDLFPAPVEDAPE